MGSSEEVICKHYYALKYQGLKYSRILCLWKMLGPISCGYQRKEHIILKQNKRGLPLISLKGAGEPTNPFENQSLKTKNHLHCLLNKDCTVSQKVEGVILFIKQNYENTSNMGFSPYSKEDSKQLGSSSHQLHTCDNAPVLMPGRHSCPSPTFTSPKLR